MKQLSELQQAWIDIGQSKGTDDVITEIIEYIRHHAARMETIEKSASGVMKQVTEGAARMADHPRLHAANGPDYEEDITGGTMRALAERAVPDRDQMLRCDKCSEIVPHRFRPSPEAGPFWRCSQCGEPHNAPDPAPTKGAPAFDAWAKANQAITTLIATSRPGSPTRQAGEMAKTALAASREEVRQLQEQLASLNRGNGTLIDRLAAAEDEIATLKAPAPAPQSPDPWGVRYEDESWMHKIGAGEYTADEIRSVIDTDPARGADQATIAGLRGAIVQVTEESHAHQHSREEHMATITGRDAEIEQLNEDLNEALSNAVKRLGGEKIAQGQRDAAIAAKEEAEAKLEDLHKDRGALINAREAADGEVVERELRLRRAETALDTERKRADDAEEKLRAETKRLDHGWKRQVEYEKRKAVREMEADLAAVTDARDKYIEENEETENYAGRCKDRRDEVIAEPAAPQGVTAGAVCTKCGKSTLEGVLLRPDGWRCVYCGHDHQQATAAPAIAPTPEEPTEPQPSPLCCEGMAARGVCTCEPQTAEGCVDQNCPDRGTDKHWHVTA